MRQGCWATKRKCSFERIRFGSLMVSTLLSIFAPAPLWLRRSDVASGSLLRFSGLTRATAQCLRCATNWGAIPDLGKVSCLRLRFRARTVSTSCSQMANKSSMSRASLIA